MENPCRDRIARRFVGLFSVYGGDSASALFQSLWCMHRNQSRPLDWSVGVIEGEISKALESVVSEFNEIEWLRIPKVNNPLNFGLPESLNFGLKTLLPSDIVLKIDTDDLYSSGRVAQTVEAFESDPDLVIFGGQIDEWNSDFTSFVGTRSVPLDDTAIRTQGLWRNPFNGPTVAFCANVGHQIGGFQQVGANEDYVLWTNILHLGGKGRNSPDVLTYMRGGADLVSRRSTARTRKGELEALRAIRRIGYFPLWVFWLHVVSKQIVRRMPMKINLYLYQRLRQSGNRPEPRVVTMAHHALLEWQK